MKISKEVKTAILVLSGIALLIFGVNYLRGESFFQSSNTFYTQFDFNNLTISSPVTVKGNVIGKIQEVSYDYGTGKTKVTFKVNEELSFSKKTKVKLYEVGPMSGSGIALILNQDGELANSGDFLESVVELGLIKNLSKNFSGLSTDLDATLRTSDTLLTNLNKLVVDDSDQGLKATIAELNKTLKSFKITSNSVNQLISKNEENITGLLEKVKQISEDFAALSTELKDADLGKTVSSLNTTLDSFNSVLTSLDKGEGSMGKLFKDDKLYNNLEGATKELEALLLDFKLHPNRYTRILSKKEIPYKEPQTK